LTELFKLPECVEPDWLEKLEEEDGRKFKKNVTLPLKHLKGNGRTASAAIGRQ
jgi:hypothetical protein